MKTCEKLSVKIIRRIAFVGIILIAVLTVGVFAAKSNLNTVTIVCSDDSEISIVTSETNVGKILEDNYIILQTDEMVTPSSDSNIDFSKKIVISKVTDEPVVVAEEVINVSKEEILGNYVTVTEKIISEQEEIPFETVTKDVSTEGTETTDKVVQEGENGLKETKYKVKYQNDTEIERTLISEEIIKEPVEKIVQISSVISSRSGSRSSGVVVSGSEWSYSAEDFDLMCAITAQEDNTSYTGALAVITTACNRAENNGTDPLTEYKKRGQFCYTIDNYWVRRLNGNYPDYVAQAVEDALNGARNHSYTSFRASGAGERIGSNVYR